MSNGYTPTDVANQSLDAIGWPEVLGDIENGDDHAQVLLRAYRECLKQLLRAANWDFARKTAPLTLLADATGNTPYVGTVVPQPWIYEYAYPTDAAKVRFIPWNLSNQANATPADNIQIPDTPLVTGLGNPVAIGLRIRPAKFIVATDYNYPPEPGQLSWQVQGVSPQGRTVILTNVKDAQCVYTAQMLYPSVWDPLFRAAFVAYLASEVALRIWAKTDKNFGLRIRGEQIAIVKSKVLEARLVDGNEGISTSDIAVDWMRTRQVGGTWARGWGDNWAGDGPGGYGGGYDSMTLADGAVF